MFVTLESQFCTTRFGYAELIKRILNFLISNLIPNTKVKYKILDSAFYLVKEHPGCKNQKPTHNMRSFLTSNTDRHNIT
jgi:hypothetical protein